MIVMNRILSLVEISCFFAVNAILLRLDYVCSKYRQGVCIREQNEQISKVPVFRNIKITLKIWIKARIRYCGVIEALRTIMAAQHAPLYTIPITALEF